MITSVPKNESTIDKSTKIEKLREDEIFLYILLVFISVLTIIEILFG
jgi:hypothetical protein